MELFIKPGLFAPGALSRSHSTVRDITNRPGKGSGFATLRSLPTRRLAAGSSRPTKRRGKFLTGRKPSRKQTFGPFANAASASRKPGFGKGEKRHFRTDLASGTEMNGIGVVSPSRYSAINYAPEGTPNPTGRGVV